MNVRTVISLAATILVLTFAVLNWSVFVDPTSLSFGFWVLEVPLGMVMLGLTLITFVLLTAYVNHVRRSALVDAGRNAEELRVQRRLADEAEASRFTELRHFLEEEFKQLSEAHAGFHADVQNRLTTLESRFQSDAQR